MKIAAVIVLAELLGASNAFVTSSTNSRFRVQAVFEKIPTKAENTQILTVSAVNLSSQAMLQDMLTEAKQPKIKQADGQCQTR